MSGTIVFRVNWSSDVGLGHVQRCLSLMDALADHGLRGLFVATEQPGCDPRVVTSRGYEVDLGSAPFPLPKQQEPEDSGVPAAATPDSQARDAAATVAVVRGAGALALVVDHYGLDGTWESLTRESLEVPVVAIDGLANRRHTADLVVDPTLVDADEDRWSGLVEPRTRVLRGPRYALIAPGFREQLQRRPPRDGHVRKVLISFGGSDPHRLAERTLDALQPLAERGITFDVIAGAADPDPDAVRARCSRIPGATFHHGTSRMAHLLAAADIAVGSGGISMYERAFLGLPALVITAAANQTAQTAEFARAGATINLGNASEVRAEDIASALAVLLGDPTCVRNMGLAARRIMGEDGMPGSLRVSDEVLSLLRGA